MGSVHTPDNLRHVGPNFHLVVLVVNPKSGEVLKVVRIALQTDILDSFVPLYKHIYNYIYINKYSNIA